MVVATLLAIMQYLLLSPSIAYSSRLPKPWCVQGLPSKKRVDGGVLHIFI